MKATLYFSFKWVMSLIFLFPWNFSLAQEGYVYFLNDQEEALDARIKILSDAKREILISYFIFEDDKVGNKILAQILLAKEKNPDLDVKIIVDAIANDVDKKLWYRLVKAGIKLKLFHALPKLFVPPDEINFFGFFRALRRFNFRMHDKILLTDARYLISGGRNIDDKYFGKAEKNFYDRDIFVDSPKLAGDVRDYFLLLWNSSHVRPLKFKRCDRLVDEKRSPIKEFLDTKKALVDDLKDFQKKHQDFIPSKIGIPFRKVRFLNSFDASKGRFLPQFLSNELFDITKNVDSSVVIETPYLLPTKRFFGLIKYLQGKQVKISFITNSFCSSDAMVVVGAYDNYKPKFYRLGIPVYEFVDDSYLHAKSAVFDDRLAILGTYNMDPRSAYLNTELVFIFEDMHVAEHLAKMIKDDVKKCVKISPKSGNKMIGYYDCNKPKIQLMMYVFFRILSDLKALYNLL